MLKNRGVFMQVSNVSNVSFGGMAVKIPSRQIRNAQDAIAQWDILKHPQFTNVFQEAEDVSIRKVRENQAIRNFNYSFLDELQGNIEKSKFIEYFKRLTGFPSLREISKKMLEEFHRTLRVSSRELGKSADDILLTGYDKFCSVGLGNALPGSDLDKGFAIIRGVSGDFARQQAHSNAFKGAIWDNIDNRIMSVNHCAAFPNIMTDTELSLSLAKFEPYAQEVVGTSARYNLFLQERMNNPNPVSGAKFNIWLSQTLPNKEQRIEAKNLAYVIEAIRDGARNIHNYSYMEKLTNEMNNSYFSWCSNVCQGYKMQSKYDIASDIITKPKLKARKEVEKNFNSWSITKQFELVKDVIRSMSGDNKNPEFSQLFYSKTDKHRLLINDILKGDVDCAFDFMEGGRERMHLFFNTPKAMERYYNFDVYKMDY